MFGKTLSVLLLLFMVGCASSPYTYYADSGSLKKGVTKYALAGVKVNLSLGHGAIDCDTTFSSEEKLTQQFIKALKKNMEAQNILAPLSDANAIKVSVVVDYTRKFIVGGKWLSRPEVSDSITVTKDGVKLASFGSLHYTTKYGYLEDAVVDMKIATFNWGVDGELKDVNLITSIIVEELKDLGS